MNDLTQFDPKGLIRESFNIDGITTEECRSIFLDWALSLPVGVDAKDAMLKLLNQYSDNADHPMCAILIEGQQTITAPRRRGGWRGRGRGGVAGAMVH